MEVLGEIRPTAPEMTALRPLKPAHRGPQAPSLKSAVGGGFRLGHRTPDRGIVNLVMAWPEGMITGSISSGRDHRGHAVVQGIPVPGGDHRARRVAVHRFPLSFREVEEILLARGIVVSYETMRKGREHHVFVSISYAVGRPHTVDLSPIWDTGTYQPWT